MSDGGIHWTIEEGADNGRVLIRLDQLPKQIHEKLKTEIARLTHQLLAQVEAKQPVRTGTLRQQTHAYVDEGVNKGGRWVRGRVRVLREEESGVNYGIVGGALEYGAPGKRRTGPVPVRGYRRQAVKVRTHTRRRPKIAAMRFLRGPAAAQRPRARAALMAIINEVVREF